MKHWITKNGMKIYRIVFGRSNVFLLSNGIRNILIDTGVKRCLGRVSSGINAIGQNSCDYIVLTHSHHDHAANAASISKQYNAKIILHKSETELLEKGISKLPKGTIPVTKFLVDNFENKVSSKFAFDPKKCDIAVDRYYDLNELGFRAYIMHTPGHTKGSISIIVDGEIAIVGDAMFGIFKGSIFPPYADDVSGMVKSWGRLVDTGCKLFLPAHGSANTRELVTNQYNKYKKRLNDSYPGVEIE